MAAQAASGWPNPLQTCSCVEGCLTATRDRWSMSAGPQLDTARFMRLRGHWAGLPGQAAAVLSGLLQELLHLLQSRAEMLLHGRADRGVMWQRLSVPQLPLAGEGNKVGARMVGMGAVVGSP